MPLGVFIKPCQQKAVCDGQRAICMCHIMLPKADKVMDSGMALKSSSGAGHENSSGGGSNYFVSAKPLIALNIHRQFFFDDQYSAYKNPFLLPLDNVPKI